MCFVVLMIAIFVLRLFGDAVARRVSHADGCVQTCDGFLANAFM
jgi:hypothetical protein